jgi:RHS repeat-associated protein
MVTTCCPFNPVPSKLNAAVQSFFPGCSNMNGSAPLNWDGSSSKWVFEPPQGTNGYKFALKCTGVDESGNPLLYLDWVPNFSGCGGSNEQLWQSLSCAPLNGETFLNVPSVCCDNQQPGEDLVYLFVSAGPPVPVTFPRPVPPCNPDIQCCPRTGGGSGFDDPLGNGNGGGPGNNPGGPPPGPPGECDDFRCTSTSSRNNTSNSLPFGGGRGTSGGSGDTAERYGKCCGDSGGSCGTDYCSLPGFSDAPVRYGTGELAYWVSDLKVEGYGLPWGHTRSFRSQLYTGSDSGIHSETIGQGYNWQVKEWPFLVQGPYGMEGTEITQVVIQGESNSSFWFDKVDGEWVPRFNVKSTLEHDTDNNVYRLTDLNGNVTEFDDYTGMFYRRITPAGNTISVTEMSSNGSNFTAVERQYTENGTTTTEKFQYEYIDEGDLLLSSVTLLRKVGAGSWQNISRAIYTYYGNDEAYGLEEDLKTATTQQWDGSTWQNTGTNYYRYYKTLSTGSSSSSSSSSGGDGFAHEIKYILGKEAYNKLAADPSVADPLTATDAQVAQYADIYYEFDSERRVTKEMIQGGSRTFTFNYEESSFDDDYNAWKTKTTETLPDGSQNIVFCNYASQPMLKILKSGDDEWYEFFKYDESANVILYASSSAISGYDDQYADLLHEVSGNYEYLRDNSGLIRTYTYHAPTNWLASSNIQEGELGTSIKLLEREYISCGSVNSSSSSSSSAGGLAYFLSKEITYPSDTDQTKKIITSYAYTWYEGTCQVKEKTTTLPVISTSQNGSGVANTRKEYFDEYGSRTWTMDERGYINQIIYDIPTGAMTQLVQDVDTGAASGVPTGWVTPSGGGLNLITDFEHDNRGRITQSLGPAHTIDLEGAATEIRTAIWIVYKSEVDENQIWQAQGYATGTSPSYTYTLINPVNISKTDKNGNLIESIQATCASTSGKLQPTDTFAQSSYVRWTTNQYTECCLLESTRAYHTIPSSGSGASGTNYDQTDYGFDSMKRRNRIVTPGGTITFNVLDVRGNIIKTFVGTDDTGATNQDPTGSGAVGNNMVQVTGLEYDGGSAGGDNNLTKQTQYATALDSRITSFTYDWRNRNTDTDGEIDYFQKLYYDNLDRITKTERYDTTTAGNLISRSETKFDDLGRVYQTLRYGVDPSTGTVGNSLTDNIWYDATGNVIKKLPAGSNLFSKQTYDSLGRRTTTYRAYDLDETSYADAGSVSDDTVIEQNEMTYDDASNVIQTNSRQRYHDAPASQTGALQDPSTTPKARVLYQANYPDAIGRTVTMTDYGTNGGTALARSSTIPSRSDTVLVTSFTFDSAGRSYQTTDSAGKVNQTEYDARGRYIKQTMNVQESSSSSSSAGCPNSLDANIVVLTTYNADGNISTLTANNSLTGNQTTTYTYGTTLSDSEIATSMLKRSETYPDSIDSSDVISFKYNRQSQITETQDQGNTVHSFDFDNLGRQTQDRITTLGTGVDGSILRIATTYEVRGMKESLTSYDNASVGSGTVVNEVQFAYNDFGQLSTDYQSHSGAVNTTTTPKVQYAFANGSDNTIRPTTLTYPDGRVLTYDYGTSNDIDDAVSRVTALIDDDMSSTHLADYEYLGLKSFVEVDYTEPDVEYTLIGTAGGNDPDTGDIYRGLDRFGRVKDSYWYDYGSSADVDRIKYGYDRVGNRTYRENVVADALSKHFDELYNYDGINRLKDMDRGRLSSLKDAINNLQLAECWSLDETGNWSKFRQDDTGNGTWDLNQSRTNNKVNEITDITESAGPSWVTPVYSKAGNMTTMPKPSDPTASFITTYDAWNRLVKIVEGASTVTEHEYDGAKRRVIKKAYSGGILDETRHFYYTEPRQWQVIEERVGHSTDPDRQFVWGLRYQDDLVLRDRDTTGNGILEERLYGLQDANWNVTSILNISGGVQERMSYAPYGKPEFLDSSFNIQGTSSVGWETLFCGYCWEIKTKLFHVRHRVYNSALGTWIQRDPLGLKAGVSLYKYVDANPINRVDPLGLVSAIECFRQLEDCINDAKIDKAECRKCAKTIRERVLCDFQYQLDLWVCDGNFFGCILTSDEVLFALTAGLITVAAILAILEPTPFGEVALVGLLAGIGVTLE